MSSELERSTSEPIAETSVRQAQAQPDDAEHRTDSSLEQPGAEGGSGPGMGHASGQCTPAKAPNAVRESPFKRPAALVGPFATGLQSTEVSKLLETMTLTVCLPGSL